MLSSAPVPPAVLLGDNPLVVPISAPVLNYQLGSLSNCQSILLHSIKFPGVSRVVGKSSSLVHNIPWCIRISGGSIVLIPAVANSINSGSISVAFRSIKSNRYDYKIHSFFLLQFLHYHTFVYFLTERLASSKMFPRSHPQFCPPIITTLSQSVRLPSVLSSVVAVSSKSKHFSSFAFLILVTWSLWPYRLAPHVRGSDRPFVSTKAVDRLRLRSISLSCEHCPSRSRRPQFRGRRRWHRSFPTVLLDHVR